MIRYQFYKLSQNSLPIFGILIYNADLNKLRCGVGLSELRKIKATERAKGLLKKRPVVS